MGTAVLKPGQYRGSHKIGKHKGYPALQQVGNLTVYRDGNRDDVVDSDSSNEQTGVFGINIHRASSSNESHFVGRWSAGCQVLADPLHFGFLMSLCRQSAKRHGPVFTYTLLEEKDFASL